MDFKSYDVVEQHTARWRRMQTPPRIEIPIPRERLVTVLPEDERGALGPIDPEEADGQGEEEAGVSDQEVEMLRQLGYVE